MDGIRQRTDLGYVGAEGIDLVPIKRKPGQDLHEKAKADNKVLSGIRPAVERAVAHAKPWRMLSEEGGRLRPPIEKFPETLAAAWGLINLKRYMIIAFDVDSQGILRLALPPPGPMRGFSWPLRRQILTDLAYS